METTVLSVLDESEQNNREGGTDVWKQDADEKDQTLFSWHLPVAQAKQRKHTTEVQNRDASKTGWKVSKEL